MAAPDKLLVFVDSSVLLHALDDADPVKRDRARQWLSVLWSRRCGRLSTQVLNEFYHLARRKFTTAIAAGDARAEVRRYQHWQPWQTDHATVETAWAVESRFGLAWWDALVVAAAQQQGCRYLLSETLPVDLQIDRVRILNPFDTSPDAALAGTPDPLSPSGAVT